MRTFTACFLQNITCNCLDPSNWSTKCRRLWLIWKAGWFTSVSYLNAATAYVRTIALNKIGNVFLKRYSVSQNKRMTPTLIIFGNFISYDFNFIVSFLSQELLLLCFYCHVELDTKCWKLRRYVLFYFILFMYFNLFLVWSAIEVKLYFLKIKFGEMLVV